MRSRPRDLWPIAPAPRVGFPGWATSALVLFLSLPNPSDARQGPTAAAGADSVAVCLDAAADYTCAYPVQVLSVSTATKLTTVFEVRKGEHRQLTARWIAVDVGKVAPPNSVMDTTSLQLDKETARGFFQSSLSRPLPLGKYRVEVLADGKPWKSADLAIVEDATLKAARPEDLLPLRNGKVWTYGLVIETTGEPPGVKRDADGKMRGTATFAATGADKQGMRIEVRRDNVPWWEEWWRIGDSGLTMTQSRISGNLFVADPPQVLLPWPLKASQAWSWEARDKSSKQTSQMWGPVSVKGPKGDAPGYVVLTSQEPGEGLIETIERRFLQGVGMVRETRITAANNSMRRLMSRIDLTLREQH